MGSLPTIRLPHLSSMAVLAPIQSPKRAPRKFAIIATSAESYPQQVSNQIQSIAIRLPGDSEERSLRFHGAPRGNSGTSLRRGNNHRGSNRQGSSNYRAGRNRDVSGAYSPQSHDNASVASGSNHPGRGRNRGGHWNSARQPSNSNHVVS